MIFGIAVDLYTVISIAVVSAATLLYAQHPVVNKGKLNDEGNKATTSSTTSGVTGKQTA